MGGDDFVAVLQQSDAAAFCRSVIEEFGCGKLQLYREDDRRRGYITAENRHGEVEKFPFVSLFVAGVLNGCRRFRNMVELTEKLAKLKKRSKQQRGDSCLWLEKTEQALAAVRLPKPGIPYAPRIRGTGM